MREVVTEDGKLIIRNINKIDIVNKLNSIEELKNPKDNNQDNHPHGILLSVLRYNTNGDPQGASIIKKKILRIITKMIRKESC